HTTRLPYLRTPILALLSLRNPSDTHIHPLSLHDALPISMTEKALDDEAEDYTRASACECDWILDSELKASVRVEIESQSKDRFRATSLTLGEGLIPSVAHVWD